MTVTSPERSTPQPQKTTTGRVTTAPRSCSANSPVSTPPNPRRTRCTPPRSARAPPARPRAASASTVDPQVGRVRQAVRSQRRLGTQLRPHRAPRRVAGQAAARTGLTTRRPLRERTTEVDPRVVRLHAGQRDVAPLRCHRRVVDLRKVDHAYRICPTRQVVEAGHRTAV